METMNITRKTVASLGIVLALGCSNGQVLDGQNAGPTASGSPAGGIPTARFQQVYDNGLHFFKTGDLDRAAVAFRERKDVCRLIATRIANQ